MISECQERMLISFVDLRKTDASKLTVVITMTKLIPSALTLQTEYRDIAQTSIETSLHAKENKRQKC